MKRSILTAVMIMGLAAASAFAASTDKTKQGSKAKPAAATQPASTGATMAASSSTHKGRHHRRRHHKAIAHKKATTRSK